MKYSEISKVISHALRHEPWKYELEINSEGWADVCHVLNFLREMRTEWRSLTVADLQKMMDCSQKKRHEILGTQIRALYGHSLPGRLFKNKIAPAPILYHGTSQANFESIRNGGLLPMGRQYVHLSVTIEDAISVGLRKSNDYCICVINAKEAHESGVVFYEGNSHVTLAEHVPLEFIESKKKISVNASA